MKGIYKKRDNNNKGNLKIKRHRKMLQKNHQKTISIKSYNNKNNTYNSFRMNMKNRISIKWIYRI